MTSHILLVEDDPNFGAVLRDYLTIHGYEVTWCQDGMAGLEAYHPDRFALCILDVMMPKVDGFEVGKEIRHQNSGQPLVFLTARSMKEDKVLGFEIGADDYITKPFDSELLLLRIKALLKRTQPDQENAVNPESFLFGGFSFDYRHRKLQHGDAVNRLSPKEADLLRLLCLRKGELLPREEALQTLWGEDNYFTARSMDVFVSKLRKHFKTDPRVKIENIHGKGFQLLIE
ncbi:MAG: response regulator transcription factor [Bacteroidota bacterium]